MVNSGLNIKWVLHWLEEAGNARKGMEMKNIAEEKVMRLSVQMNVKNKKNQNDSKCCSHSNEDNAGVKKISL